MLLSLVACDFEKNTDTTTDSRDEFTHQTTQNNKNEQTEDNTKAIERTQDTTKATEKIELTKENYGKYIATYTREIAHSDSTTFYYEFEGASCCKFENAKIKYCFSKNDEIPDDAESYTCELNLSGCGQSKAASRWRSSPYKLIIVDVQGTVEILQ